MLTLPEGVKPDFLSGCFLSSIQFGGLNIILSFRKPLSAGAIDPYTVTINSMTEMQFQIGENVTSRDMSDLKSCVFLIDFLIEFDVTDVFFGENESVEIRFTNDRKITIFRNEAGFESYEIIFNNGEVLEV